MSSSTLICSLTGEECRHPVVSAVSGRIFEKDILLKHLSATGLDPVTSRPLTLEQVIPIQAGSGMKMRAPDSSAASSSNSIPQLLHQIQSEWDNSMLEILALRKQLFEAKKQTTVALYQYDAACRVIARLQKQNDALKSASGSAAALDESTQDAGVDASMDTDQVDNIPSRASLPSIQEIASKFISEAGARSKNRKKRWKVPQQELLSPESVSKFKLSGSLAIHGSGTKLHGISAFVNLGEERSCLISGGHDGSLFYSNYSTLSILGSVDQNAGHKAPVSSLGYALKHDVLVSGAIDGSAMVWSVDEAGSINKLTDWETVGFGKSAEGVAGISIHPSEEYVAVAGSGNSWKLASLELGSLVHEFQDSESEHHRCVEFHPDGALIATGCQSGSLRLWEMSSETPVQELIHGSEITSMSFSANGFYVATGDIDGVVKLWDLRKFRVLSELKTSFPVNSLTFNGSGHYICAGAGKELCVWPCFATTTHWNPVLFVESLHTDTITSVWCSQNMDCILTGSLDSHLRRFSL